MTKHIPVLSCETIKYLAPQKNQNFIDATCGLGGHTKVILEKTAPRGQVLAIDKDEEALEVAKKNLEKFERRVEFYKGNFSDIGLVVRRWKKEKIDGIIFDLGVSSYQLEAPERGFSFLKNGPLDMRMSQDSRISARDIVNSWSKNQLQEIFFQFGQEPYASKIAQEIVKARQSEPIKTTNDLVSVIKKATPPRYRQNLKKHFATRVFQALRIVVNDELKALENALKQAVQIISPNGRIVVISFHSLEDRIVKNFFNENSKLQNLTQKPVLPSTEEIKANPRARSAKLRAAIKINEGVGNVNSAE